MKNFINISQDDLRASLFVLVLILSTLYGCKKDYDFAGQGAANKKEPYVSVQAFQEGEKNAGALSGVQHRFFVGIDNKGNWYDIDVEGSALNDPYISTIYTDQIIVSATGKDTGRVKVNIVKFFGGSGNGLMQENFNYKHASYKKEESYKMYYFVTVLYKYKTAYRASTMYSKIDIPKGRYAEIKAIFPKNFKGHLVDWKGSIDYKPLKE